MTNLISRDAIRGDSESIAPADCAGFARGSVCDAIVRGPRFRIIAAGAFVVCDRARRRRASHCYEVALERLGGAQNHSLTDFVVAMIDFVASRVARLEADRAQHVMRRGVAV